MPWTEPLIEPLDPEAFRRRVYRRAEALRRMRRMVVAGSLSVLALVIGSATVLGEVARRPATQIAAPRAQVSSPTTAPSPRTPQSPTTPSTMGDRQRAGGSRSSTGPATQGHPGPGDRSSSPRASNPPASTATGAPGSVTTVPVVTTVSTSCSQPQPPVPSVPVTPRLVGTWVQCSSDSIFGTGGHDAGLAINADRTWVRLGLGPSGTLVALTGPEDHGTWTTTAATFSYVPGRTEVDFITGTTSTPGPGGRWATQVSYVPGPPGWLLFSEAGWSARYVATTCWCTSGRNAAHGKTSRSP